MNYNLLCYKPNTDYIYLGLIDKNNGNFYTAIFFDGLNIKKVPILKIKINNLKNDWLYNKIHYISYIKNVLKEFVNNDYYEQIIYTDYYIELKKDIIKFEIIQKIKNLS